MLEHLAKIDWSRVMGAHGPCEQLPDLLRTLVLPAPESDRASARSGLREMILHQGTAYEVTPFVVPLLVELADVELPDRAWALGLLRDIASSERACDAAQLAPFADLDPAALSRPPYFEDQEEWEPDDEAYFRSVVLAGKAVRWGVGTYLRALASGDDAVIAAALDLLAICDPSPAISAALGAHLDRLRDPMARANALRAYALHEPAAARPLLERAIASGSAPERFVGALVLAEMQPVADGVAEALVELLASVDAVGAKQMPFVVDAYASITRALLRLSLTDDQRERALARLVSAFEARALRPFACGVPIIQLAFPEPLRPEGRVEDLTDAQRQVLRTVGALAWSRKGDSFVQFGDFAYALDAKRARNVTLEVLGLTEWVRARHPGVLR